MHPSRDELAGYVFGTLPEEQVESIGAHVEECATCEDTVRNLEATGDDVLAKLRQPRPAEPFADEPSCGRTIELINAIGRESSLTRHEPDIGQVRVYKLLAKLGEGGMGAVYKALHTELDKVVALKVLPADRLQDRDAVDRFKREMKAVGKLEHPNIVRATDAGEDAGTHYLVMELIDGVDVAALVKQHGPLPIPAACEIIRQAALGLQYAHQHGLVHRDIKPSNIMLTGFSSKARGTQRVGFTTEQLPTVKILDLGLALLAGQHHERDELTTTGRIMGTVDYMAPEQGSDTHRVDIRADLYSLGATLYKLLTGRAPFEGPQYNSTMKKLTALATQMAQPVRELRPDIPEALAAIVHQLLAKSPNDRPPTPRIVAEQIAPFASTASLAALLDRTAEPPVTKPPTGGSAGVIPETVVPSPSISEGTPKSAVRVASAPDSASSSPTFPIRLRTWLVAAALFLVAAVITITTAKGTVTIRQPDGMTDEVEIVVRSGGENVAIMDKSNHWTVSVQNGEYTVAVRGGSERFQVKNGKLSVKRFGKTLVEVEAKPAEVASQPVKQTSRVSSQPSADTDRRVAEVLLRSAATVTVVVPENVPNARQTYELGVGSSYELPIKGAERVLKRVEDLPAEAFFITRIKFSPKQNQPIEPAILKQLQSVKYLIDLDVEDTSLDDSRAELLAELGQIRHLNVSANSLSNEGLRHLSRLKDLKWLAAWRLPGISDSGLEYIGQLTELQGVHLQENPQITDRGAAALRPLKKIYWFWLCQTGVTDAALEIAGEFKDLDSICLANTKITGTGFVHLTKTPKLNWIYVPNTPMTDENGVLLGKVRFHSLIASNTGIGDRTLEAIGGHKQFHRLQLDGTRITDAGLAHLAGVSVVQLMLNDTDVNGSGLRDIRVTEHLELKGTKLTDEAARSLANKEPLSKLDIASTPVSKETVQFLVESLPSCRIVSNFGTFEPKPADGPAQK